MKKKTITKNKTKWLRIILSAILVLTVAFSTSLGAFAKTRHHSTHHSRSHSTHHSRSHSTHHSRSHSTHHSFRHHTTYHSSGDSDGGIPIIDLSGLSPEARNTVLVLLAAAPFVIVILIAVISSQVRKKKNKKRLENNHSTPSLDSTTPAVLPNNFTTDITRAIRQKDPQFDSRLFSAIIFQDLEKIVHILNTQDLTDLDSFSKGSAAQKLRQKISLQQMQASSQRWENIIISKQFLSGYRRNAYNEFLTLCVEFSVIENGMNPIQKVFLMTYARDRIAFENRVPNQQIQCQGCGKWITNDDYACPFCGKTVSGDFSWTLTDWNDFGNDLPSNEPNGVMVES